MEIYASESKERQKVGGTIWLINTFCGVNIVNVKNILKTSGYQVQKVILSDMYFNCECTDIFLDWKTTK